MTNLNRTLQEQLKNAKENLKKLEETKVSNNEPNENTENNENK